MISEIKLPLTNFFRITLGTKTGMVETRQKIEDVIMTKPLPPRGLRVSDEEPNSCKIHWLHPEKNHSCLKGYNIQIRSSDNRPFNKVHVLKSGRSFFIQGKIPSTGTPRNSKFLLHKFVIFRKIALQKCNKSVL